MAKTHPDPRRTAVATWDRHVLAEHQRRLPLHDGSRLTPVSFTLDGGCADCLDGTLRSLEPLLPAPYRSRPDALRSTAVEVAVTTYATALTILPETPGSPSGVDGVQLASGMLARMSPSLRAQLVAVEAQLSPSLLGLVDTILRRVVARDLPAKEASAWLSEHPAELRSALFEEAVSQWLTLRHDAAYTGAGRAGAVSVRRFARLPQRVRQVLQQTQPVHGVGRKAG
jgi:hypothetical protein